MKWWFEFRSHIERHRNRFVRKILIKTAIIIECIYVNNIWKRFWMSHVQGECAWFISTHFFRPDKWLSLWRHKWQQRRKERETDKIRVKCFVNSFRWFALGWVYHQMIAIFFSVSPWLKSWFNRIVSFNNNNKKHRKTFNWRFHQFQLCIEMFYQCNFHHIYRAIH